MKRTFIFLNIFFTLIITGCSNIVEVSHNVNVPYEAIPELEVNTLTKITATATRGYLFHFLPMSGDNNYLYYNSSNNDDNSGYDKVKAAANFNALRKAPDADLIISPSYTIIVDNYFIFYKKVTVTVSGYPAKIKGFKNRSQITNY
ncbi:MAG TPA: hypothetical protein PLY84_04610 [Bacilli bacterium]|jgi:hypothetical protein|nr:hypothetical protein [Ignavibacteriales bacterium]HPT89643.1 hypothetical protein [Bacilli bacterium]